MKKNRLFLALLSVFIFLGVNAQHVINNPNDPTTLIHKSNYVVNHGNTINQGINSKYKSTNGISIHSAYNPYINYLYNLSGNVVYYIEPLFYDSLAVSYFIVNNKPTAEQSFVMGIGSVIDPTSSLFDLSGIVDNNGNSLPNLQLDKRDKYTLDTIGIPALYKRVSVAGIVDTLKVQVVYGDTADQKHLQKTPFYAFSFVGSTNQYASPIWLKSLDGLRGSSTMTTKTYTKLLTTSDSSSKYFTFKTALDIPAGKIFGALITYRSGIKAQNGDIYYSQKAAQDSGKIQNHNSFVMLDIADNGGDNNAFYDASTFTCPYILTKKTKYGLYGNDLDVFLYPLTSQVYDIDYIITANSTLGIGQTKVDGLTVSQNMPNPAKGSTTINYELAKSANVSVEIFDITGKNVMTINSGKTASGKHSMNIDLSKLSGGVYYYTFNADDTRVSKKMIVME
ncbi:MAG: T9SS type A sorting domain-containing protein [Bacteroidota bacterium]|nr:T9SS type A sorting domain-containing protein [Bacteroidota bacterium]